MRLYRGVSAGVVSGAVVLLASSSVLAQEVAAEATTDGEVEASAEAAPEEAAPEEAAAEAPSEEVPAEEPAPEPVVEEAPMEEAPVEEAAEEEDGPFSYMFFGDAYATFQTAQPGSGVPGHRAYASASPAGTNEDGFSLSFAGLDLAYAGKGWGVTTSLRFGPSVVEYYADPTYTINGLAGITQAFVTWAPTDAITLDFGQFGTIYGAEVAESWLNLNYTRGALYYAMQPFWHTGLRAGFALGENFGLKVLVVNDANTISLDPGSDLQAGVQLTGSAGDLGFAIGTLQTLGESNPFIDRFFDAVVTYGTDSFSLVFNGDLNIADAGDGFWGVSLAAGIPFSDMFGVALRGELLDPSIDTDDDFLVTGTLTLDVKPVPDAENVVLRWDNRIESQTGAFFDRDGAASDIWFGSTIGLAIYTDGTF